MSSYQFTAKNKATGEEKVVMAYDDYFGRHQYGYDLGDVILNETSFNYGWKRVDMTPPKTDEVEEMVKRAEYLGSPYAESLSDNERLVALIHLAQSIPSLVTSLHQSQEERMKEMVDEILKAIESDPAQVSSEGDVRAITQRYLGDNKNK